MATKTATGTFVRRRELLAMLRERRVSVTEAQLRRYQVLGIIPRPRRFGRVGRGRGVDWGWPMAEARAVANLLSLLPSDRKAAQEFAALVNRYPAALEHMAELVRQAQERGYEQGREDAFRELEEGTL